MTRSPFEVFGNPQKTGPLYHEIGAAASLAPIAEVLDRLDDDERTKFIEKFTLAVANGELDNSGLCFLGDDEWIDFDAATWGKLLNLWAGDRPIACAHIENAAVRFGDLAVVTADRELPLPKLLWPKVLRLQLDEDVLEVLGRLARDASAVKEAPSTTSDACEPDADCAVKGGRKAAVKLKMVGWLRQNFRSGVPNGEPRKPILERMELEGVSGNISTLKRALAIYRGSNRV